MKIIFVITRADTVAGAQIHVRDLSLALAERGHSALVISGARGEFTRMLEEKEIECVSVPELQRRIDPIRDFQAFWKIKKLIRDVRPDLVSLHSGKAGILGRIVCRVLGQACLFTAHGWSFTPGVGGRQQWVFKMLERAVESFSSRIICVSEYDRQLAIEAGMNPARVVTIHNGMPNIPHLELADAGRSGDVVGIMVARFDRQKDHETLISALEGIDDLRLILVGEGPALEACKGMVERKGLSNRVVFKGYTRNVQQHLMEAQIFLLISNWEGFPRTTLEAMRGGLPCVVSNVGGSAEALEEGRTGYVVERGDILGLRERLVHLVKNPELRTSMGTLGRERYLEEFTFSRMFEETTRIYEDVVGKGRGRFGS